MLKNISPSFELRLSADIRNVQNGKEDKKVKMQCIYFCARVCLHFITYNVELGTDPMSLLGLIKYFLHTGALSFFIQKLFASSRNN